MGKNLQEISDRIKELAVSSGFTDCGIAPAEQLTEDAARLRKWLEEGMQAGMKYMENYFDKRTDPSLLVPGARSVIVLLLNYFPEQQQEKENNLILSKYAYGRDYHPVMKAMLKRFMQSIHEEIIPLQGRFFVDSAPVLERALASMAGLGWIGKNANLISPKHGSFCFIGEIITDVELDYNNQAIPDFCGSCRKCIEACPTNAIVADRVIDSRKCISYWTIEHKDEIDPLLKEKFDDRIFGCDICQDVCPWNRKAQPNKTDAFRPSPDLIKMTRKDWQELTKSHFHELFDKMAVIRTGFDGLIRNIRFVTGQ